MKNNSDFLTVATPAPWDRGAPVINGPVLWGATPGRELLYALPVRGERPLHFEWSGEIPPGLRLDPDRGFVTGRAPAGIYRLRFLVSNRLGRAEKPFRFEIAPNRLCRTPLLGWSSWNACVDLVTQEAVAEAALKAVYEQLSEKQVTLYGDARAREILPDIEKADESDWAREYLAYKMSVKVVASLDEAVAHIAKYSSGHSDCIVTENAAAAERFLNEVDSAAVYWNASTRFTDGGCFGFGAEIGISTQKLHARGPLGLPQLTSFKYKIYGDGQVR